MNWVGHTADHDWTQTSPLMAPNSRSCVQSMHIAWESETHWVVSLDADVAQKPAVCAHSPISPNESAVMPGMHSFVRFAQRFPLSLAIQSQFWGQVQLIVPPHPSEPEPQPYKLAGGSEPQVIGVQQLPFSRQTSFGKQHEMLWHAENPCARFLRGATMRRGVDRGRAIDCGLLTWSAV